MSSPPTTRGPLADLGLPGNPLIDWINRSFDPKKKFHREECLRRLKEKPLYRIDPTTGQSVMQALFKKKAYQLMGEASALGYYAPGDYRVFDRVPRTHESFPQILYGSLVHLDTRLLNEIIVGTESQLKIETLKREQVQQEERHRVSQETLKLEMQTQLDRQQREIQLLRQELGSRDRVIESLERLVVHRFPQDRSRKRSRTTTQKGEIGNDELDLDSGSQASSQPTTPPNTPTTPPATPPATPPTTPPDAPPRS